MLMGWVVLGEGLGMFRGRAVATREGRMFVRLMTTTREFPEHLICVIYVRQFPSNISRYMSQNFIHVSVRIATTSY
jgi:hypothetical protein